MPVVATIGAQWGDEGKGKVVDLLAEKAKMVVRYSGGNNAGHTVINHLGEFKMHLIPCGVFHATPICVIGNGVVVDPSVLLDEIEMITRAGISLEGRLVVSSRAHVIMPYHILLDGLDEEARGEGAIGTTRRGIGPAYSDKAARLGIRMADLLDKDILWNRLSSVLEQKNRVLTKLYDAQPFSLDEIHRQYYDYGQRLGRFVHDAEFMVQDVVASGGLVILEGSQGTLLDLDFGTYPYVTSSSATAAGGPVGIGLSPSRVDKVLGVFKAYTTRVGAGPMPTELKDEVGETIRDRGQEYGATTGRARRCGWFDAVAARYSARVNGLDGAALMRLDVLDDFPYVKLCTGYEIDGSVTTAFPVSSEVLDKCQPVYEMMPGWSESTTGTRRFKDLPVAAQGFVSRVEELIGCSIDLVSVGADREQSIIIKPIF